MPLPIAAVTPAAPQSAPPWPEAKAWLALDCGTEQLSVALQTPAGQVLGHTSAGAAQSSHDLIPVVLRLMHDAGVDWPSVAAIAFGAGPGSFTGLRTACSVAQGLALGAGLPLVPVDSLLAVAEEARWQHSPQATVLEVATALDARMHELYTGHYRYADGLWHTVQGATLVAPAGWRIQHGIDQPLLLAGNVWTVYADDLSNLGTTASQITHRLHAMPTALAMLRLLPQLWRQGAAVDAAQALPWYVRDKVAQTTAEREAIKQAASGAASGGRA